MNEETVPKSIEDRILSYLKDQEHFEEALDDLVYEPKSTTAEDEVKLLMEELLVKINKRIACRDRYDNMKQWHHQYPLFDLNNFLHDFCIDDEMFKKLTFRETLLISEIDSPSNSLEVEPKAVGGLCLDIQIVEGHHPDRKELPTDSELDREVFHILQRAKTMTEKQPSLTDNQLEQEVQQKLKEYESFLMNEMHSNVKKFLVHFSSQFEVEGCNAGSTINAWVDRYLHTLEEKREEFIVEPNGLNEQTLFVAIQNHKYYSRHTNNLEDLDLRKYFPFFITKNLVLEGASFLLMRYLAITKYEGTIELSTMHISGGMCRNIYECLGQRQGEVNGKTVDICKIYRYIIEECGVEHNSVTVLTTHGRIITHEWEGCNYMLNMNPLQYIDKEEPAPYQRFVMTKTWQEDMQLMSKYLDCKTTAERQIKTYMADHPEVKEMVADYVQNVLLLKPENIMAFTMDYFQNLDPCKTPHNSYLENNRDKRSDD